MASFKNITTALLTFLSGVLFAYYTYPFMEALITALDDAGFADWNFVKGIAWVGLFAIYIIWIVVIPLKLGFTDEAPSQ